MIYFNRMDLYISLQRFHRLIRCPCNRYGTIINLVRIRSKVLKYLNSPFKLNKCVYRLKETIEKITKEKDEARLREQQSSEQIKKHSRQIREMKEDYVTIQVRTFPYILTIWQIFPKMADFSLLNYYFFLIIFSFRVKK